MPRGPSFLSHAAHQFAEQRIGGIASPLALLRRHIGHVAEPSTTTRVLRGDDGRRFRGLGALLEGGDGRMQCSRLPQRDAGKAIGRYVSAVLPVELPALVLGQQH